MTDDNSYCAKLRCPGCSLFCTNAANLLRPEVGQQAAIISTPCPSCADGGTSDDRFEAFLLAVNAYGAVTGRCCKKKRSSPTEGMSTFRPSACRTPSGSGGWGSSHDSGGMSLECPLYEVDFSAPLANLKVVAVSAVTNMARPGGVSSRIPQTLVAAPAAELSKQELSIVAGVSAQSA